MGIRYFFLFVSAHEILPLSAATVLAQSVERVDCRVGGRGFDSWGWTNTQGLKITEK